MSHPHAAPASCIHNAVMLQHAMAAMSRPQQAAFLRGQERGAKQAGDLALLRAVKAYQAKLCLAQTARR